MKTFLRITDFLEESIVPPAPDPRDEEEKERYVTRQLWWALIGLALFALAMFFGWGGAHAANAGPVGAPTAQGDSTSPANQFPSAGSTPAMAYRELHREHRDYRIHG